MVIQRDKYIEALISKRWNGKVKIITGNRRCGKSFLLLTLLVSYLFYWKSPLYHNIDIQNNPKSITGLGFCMYT